MVWSEGNMSLKNPVTTPGIDPGTIRLVAQRLNHYATPGPVTNVKQTLYQNNEIIIINWGSWAADIYNSDPEGNCAFCKM